jgi:hypothetical protein|uniref:Uncharacterized protein n=1 Tax=Mus musculus TaxID=10090 RepID=Q9D5X6_MOUSE|nr:unnamed protein product [Mus musculus]
MAARGSEFRSKHGHYPTATITSEKLNGFFFYVLTVFCLLGTGLCVLLHHLMWQQNNLSGSYLLAWQWTGCPGLFPVVRILSLYDASPEPDLGICVPRSFFRFPLTRSLRGMFRYPNLTNKKCQIRESSVTSQFFLLYCFQDFEADK